MAKAYDNMEFDITLANEIQVLGASSEHDNAYEDFDKLP